MQPDVVCFSRHPWDFVYQRGDHDAIARAAALASECRRGVGAHGQRWRDRRPAIGDRRSAIGHRPSADHGLEGFCKRASGPREREGLDGARDSLRGARPGRGHGGSWMRFRGSSSSMWPAALLFVAVLAVIAVVVWLVLLNQ
jgi:hypothetical protein